MSKYYNISRVKGVDGKIKILLGGRNIGKSYAVKHDVAKDCFQTGTEFIYLRRWDEDIKTTNVVQYFADLDVEKVTDGKYKDIYVYQSRIYFTNLDENGKPTERYLVGYAHSLNQGERYKSQIYPKVRTVIYEEFITNKQYIKNEPDELLEYISTIYRTNEGVVYLIGNTISKLCPYFNEWNLERVVKMKTHEIAVFEKETEVITKEKAEVVSVRIVVEMCGADTVLSKMAFGDSANMIIKNTWKTKTVPTITHEVLDECEELHRIYVYADNLVFRMLLLDYNGQTFWYVVPSKEPMYPEQERVITPEASMNPMHTNSFIPLSERESLAFMLIKQNKIYYCSNSCGSDFQQVLKRYHMVI